MHISSVMAGFVQASPLLLLLRGRETYGLEKIEIPLKRRMVFKIKAFCSLQNTILLRHVLIQSNGPFCA